MFKKIVTSVDIRGGITKETRGTVDAEKVGQDMAEELRRISSIARSGNTRIQAIEETTHALVITYTNGAVKIYTWVAGA